MGHGARVGACTQGCGCALCEHTRGLPAGESCVPTGARPGWLCRLWSAHSGQGERRPRVGSVSHAGGECRTHGWGAPTGGFWGAGTRRGTGGGVCASLGAHTRWVWGDTRVAVTVRVQRGAAVPRTPSPAPAPRGHRRGWSRLPERRRRPRFVSVLRVTHSWHMWHHRGAGGATQALSTNILTRHRAAASPRSARPRGEGAGFTPRCSSAGDSFLHRIRR